MMNEETSVIEKSHMFVPSTTPTNLRPLAIFSLDAASLLIRYTISRKHAMPISEPRIVHD